MTTSRTLLIIDDREDLHAFCSRVLGASYAFHRARSYVQAEAILRTGAPPIEAVLVDRDFTYTPPEERIDPSGDPRDEGVRLLRWIRASFARLPVLMVTGYREQRVALEAAELGADFLAWEDVIRDPHVLRGRIEKILEETTQAEERILGQFREHGLIVESRAFAQELVAMQRALAGKTPVLLLGETGTGKDTLAFCIHALSGDSSRPYLNVNAAELSPSLIESELFGHVKGAFTSADRAHLGRFRAAHGGTLFLNEVGELSRGAQAKLLRVLETHEVVPVGGVESHHVDFQLIAATSDDLDAHVASGLFRKDLYYRLAWTTVHVPPLRERREDIPNLVRRFLRDSGQQEHGGGITQEALEYLRDLSWPGNVRELRAVVESARMASRYVITLADVHAVVRRRAGSEPTVTAVDPVVSRTPETPRRSLRDANTETVVGRAPSRSESPILGRLAETEAPLEYRELTRLYFHQLFRAANGNLARVAEMAGIAKGTAYHWLAKFGPPD